MTNCRYQFGGQTADQLLQRNNGPGPVGRRVIELAANGSNEGQVHMPTTDTFPPTRSAAQYRIPLNFSTCIAVIRIITPQ